MSRQRQTSLDQIRADGAFDVLVIGGGINGLGVYRELSLQGLRVLLAERSDFCSGCSAAPSRMIHGGLRYLENGEVALVKESLAERDALLRNAPHMVRPLPTVIPLTSSMSGLFNAAAGFLGRKGRPAQRGALPVKIGLSLYDMVTRRRRALPPHRFRGRKASLAKWPALMPGLRWSATYHDAWISHPERLGIELVSDTAAMAPGSVALNYAEILPEGDGFVLACHETGARLPVTAKAVVNAAGAWLDQVRHALVPGAEAKKRLVSGTKGSHLILDNSALYQALDGHMVFFEHTDGRVCIVFPYLGKVLAGSTDIRVETAERTRCEDHERDYILGSLRRIFPQVPVAEGDIVFSYSGIRPLPSSDHAFTGRISRGHFTHLEAGPVPCISMVGGKWTTFRAFAEQTADEVLRLLGHSRRLDTRALPIGGGRKFRGTARTVQDLRAGHGTAEARAAHLVCAYGSRAEEVLAYCAACPDDRPLAPGAVLSRGEIAWMVEHEHACRLADVVLRRTPLAITGAADAGLIAGIAAAMAAELGWSLDKTAAETAALTDELHRFHGVSPVVLEQRSTTRSKKCA